MKVISNLELIQRLNEVIYAYKSVQQNAWHTYVSTGHIVTIVLIITSGDVPKER